MCARHSIVQLERSDSCACQGWNGRLGQGNDDDHVYPQLVTLAEQHRIVEVAAGDFHTAAVTREGKLLVWGSGFNGRCDGL